MAFRIRSECVNVEQEEYESKEKLYRDHLEKLTEKDPHLWKYFYWDTFHDGRITKISFWDKPGDITFHIECPNIKIRDGHSFKYMDAEFECHFKGVVKFSYEHDDPEDLIHKQPYLRVFEYLYSEIDTLTDAIKECQIIDEDEVEHFHSLIMLVLDNNSGVYIELVFKDLYVIPKEPIAYELMLVSDDFYIPIYRENEDIDNLPKWI